jgi:hypothetical protein
MQNRCAALGAAHLARFGQRLRPHEITGPGCNGGAQPAAGDRLPVKGRRSFDIQPLQRELHQQDHNGQHRGHGRRRMQTVPARCEQRSAACPVCVPLQQAVQRCLRGVVNRLVLLFHALILCLVLFSAVYSLPSQTSNPFGGPKPQGGIRPCPDFYGQAFFRPGSRWSSTLAKLGAMTRNPSTTRAECVASS